jgi:hypothetical protein
MRGVLKRALHARDPIHPVELFYKPGQLGKCVVRILGDRARRINRAFPALERHSWRGDCCFEVTGEHGNSITLNNDPTLGSHARHILSMKLGVVRS